MALQAKTYFVLWIDGHFEDVGAQFEVRYINPLAINVGIINIFTAWCDALIAIIFTIVLGFLWTLAFIVFQAKTGFMAF